MAATQRHYKSCAVVGGSSILREHLQEHRGLGAEIDAHEAVFRFNDHPFGANWTEMVGKKVLFHAIVSIPSHLI